MDIEPAKPSHLARFLIVAATIVLLGAGWVAVQRTPGPVVTYVTTPQVEVATASPEDEDAEQPRACQPEKGVNSACIYE